MTLVKICGITNLEDAQLAVSLGADMLGFNFYEKSPRFIEPTNARAIISQLPDSVEKVGVFVNEPQERIFEIVEQAGLNSVQLHGDEIPEYVEILKGLKIIKAFRLSPDLDRTAFANYKVHAILLDAFTNDEYGGTGETCDWNAAAEIAAQFPKFFLSGGLGPDNVSESIATVRPYAVDACSRLESIKGKKNPEKLEKFIAAAKRL